MGSQFALACVAERYDVSLDWLIIGEASRIGSIYNAVPRANIAILPVKAWIASDPAA